MDEGEEIDGEPEETPDESLSKLAVALRFLIALTFVLATGLCLTGFTLWRMLPIEADVFIVLLAFQPIWIGFLAGVGFFLDESRQSRRWFVGAAFFAIVWLVLLRVFIGLVR